MTRSQTQAQRNRYHAACAKKRDEDRAVEERRFRPAPDFTPRQIVIVKNVTKLSDTLRRLTARAMKTGNDDLERMILEGIQRLDKQAARIEKRMEDFIE